MSVGEIFMLLSLAIGIVYILVGPDGVMSEEEYIRTHPEEFRK